jgi:putative exosortase-associated protein (TIGR04073 family)
MRTAVHDAAESQAYGRKCGGMIGRGAINVVTSFVDLLVNVVNETRNGPPVVGTLVGVGKGAGCMGLRALSGGVDLATFWVPGFNGFPVSDSYDNCLAGMAAMASSPTPEPLITSGEAEIGAAETAWPSDSVAVVTPSAPAPAPAEEKPRYTK